MKFDQFQFFAPFFDFIPFIGFETLLIRKQIRPQKRDSTSIAEHKPLAMFKRGFKMTLNELISRRLGELVFSNNQMSMSFDGF